jgi:hypothetical protein
MVIPTLGAWYEDTVLGCSKRVGRVSLYAGLPVPWYAGYPLHDS